MTRVAHLKFNDLAPDLDVQIASGAIVRLSSFWENGTVILSFARHFGCPQCKEMIDQLVQAAPEMERAGLRLILVTQGTTEQTSEFCRQRSLNTICLADPNRLIYQAYGLGRGNLRQTFLSPSVWIANIRARRKGFHPELPPKGQDAMQLSGIFIIGSDGRIRLPYYYDTIADHPPVDLLLRGVLGSSWRRPFEAPLVSEKE